MQAKIKIIICAFILVCFSLEADITSEKIDYYGDVSDTFIIRWAFQESSKFVFDPRTSKWQWPTSPEGVSFNPKEVQPGDWVFMRDAVEWFSKMHPLIEHPYILVTMGEWRDAMDDDFLKYLDDEKVIAWFCIHGCIKTHPKFHLLPLGIFQKREFYDNKSEINGLFKQLRDAPKKRLLYSNHGDMFGKKTDRKELDAYMVDKPWCHKGTMGMEFIDYMKELGEFKFTLSPRGYGIDCYRTYEALLVGTIPIVKTSQLDPLFEGLPVLIVNNWEELTEEFLIQKYEEITSKSYNLEKLYLEYWLQRIALIKEDYEENRSFLTRCWSRINHIKGFVYNFFK